VVRFPDLQHYDRAGVREGVLSGSDPWIDTLKAFGVFFIGFVARPIGAAIFGHYGDRIGRKATLIVTLLMTGIATTAVGLVPATI